MAASPRSKTWLTMVVGLLVSLACLGWVGFQLLGNAQQRAQVIGAFNNANYAWLPAIWLALYVFYALKAWRWRLLLAGVGNYRPLRDLLPPIMIGFAFNNILPARIGEFVRCAVFSRQQKIPLAVSIASLVLERIFDGLAIVFYLAIGLFFVQGLPAGVQETATAFSCAAVLVVIVSLCYVIWTKPIVALMEAMLKRVPFLPPVLVNKVCRILEGGAQGLAAIKSVRLVTAMLILSLVKWALNGLIMLFSLWAFQLPATPVQGCVLMGAVAFMVAIPTAPGFFGVIQVVYVEVGKLFGFPPEVMFAASIFYHLAQWTPVTVTGLIYFALSGMRLSQVEPPEIAASPTPANP